VRAVQQLQFLRLAWAFAVALQRYWATAGFAHSQIEYVYRGVSISPIGGEGTMATAIRKRTSKEALAAEAAKETKQ